MNIPISRRLKRHIKAVTDDSDYAADLEARQAYLRNITECIESPFGVILIKALEDIESSALAVLYESDASMITNRAKAEIKVAKYLKATIMGYVMEQANLDNAIKQYIEMEQGEQTNDQ